MLPARAWELLCGSLLAYTGFTPAGQKGKSLCILAGLGLMFASIIFYNDVLFPGFWALPPCLGAVLYIAGGSGYIFTNRTNLIHFITNNKVLVFIGVISYSLYLWHWPVLVLYTNYPFPKMITFPAVCLLILLIFVLSYLSWRFVEKPVRQLPVFKNRKFLWPVTILILAGVFYMATVMRAGRSYAVFTCSQKPFTACPQQVSSEQKNAQGKIPVDFIFIGDSHGEANEGLFQYLAQQYQLTGVFCTFSRMKNTIWKNDDYKKIKDAELQWDELTNLYTQYTCKNLFLIFRYVYKINGKERYYSQDREYPLVYLPNKKLSPEQGFLQSMREMLAEAAAHGIKHIYIQYPVPEPKGNIPAKANSIYYVWGDYIAQFDRTMNEKLGEKVDEYQKRNKTIFGIFAQLKKEYPQIEFIDITPYLLDKEKQQFNVMNETELFYYDDDHLSFEGSMQFYGAYDKIFAQIAEEKSMKTENSME